MSLTGAMADPAIPYNGSYDITFPSMTLDPTIHTWLNATVNNVDNVPLSTNMDILTMTRHVVQRILVPIVVTVGVVGNSMSIAVLTQKSLNTSTNCYLTALAIFDSLYLLFSFTLSFKHYADIAGSDVYKYWYPIGRVFTDMWSNVSVCLTVTFTVERYIGVCHPMKGRVICTPQRARLITIIVGLAALCCTIPEFWEWKVIEKNVGNLTKLAWAPTEFSQTYSYQMGYYWFLVTAFTFVPLVSLCTFNGILIRSVFRATRIRKRMTYSSMNRDNKRQNGEQNRITLMLISVAVVFLVCQFPTAILLLYSTYLDAAEVDQTEREANNVRIAANVTNLLIQINASINFILYSAMSTKFRRVFVRLFCRCMSKYSIECNKTEFSFVSGASFTKRQSGPARQGSQVSNQNSFRSLLGQQTPDKKPGNYRKHSFQDDFRCYQTNSNFIRLKKLRTAENGIGCKSCNDTKL